MWKRFLLPVLLSLIATLPVLAGDVTTRIGAGSGFVISSDGYVLTNYHVVEGATDIEVWFQDGTSAKATVVDYSPTWEDGGYDIALLRVSASGLPALSLGDSSAVGLYESVVAIGYPLGFELGVALNATGGHVSSFRGYSEELSLLQIDAAVNRGNSGGPLLSEDGLVVGIVTAGITRIGDQDVQGVNFAVPVNYARQLVERRGIALPQPTPADTGRAIQEIVREASASVVYIRVQSRIALSEFLPASVGSLQLGPPSKCPTASAYGSGCAKFFGLLIQVVGEQRWATIRDSFTALGSTVLCESLFLEPQPTRQFLAWLTLDAVNLGLISKEELSLVADCTKTAWRWSDLYTLPAGTSSQDPAQSLSGHFVSFLPHMLTGYVTMPGLWPQPSGSPIGYGTWLSPVEEFAGAAGRAGNTSVTIWVMKCGSSSEASQLAGGLKSHSMLPFSLQSFEASEDQCANYRLRALGPDGKTCEEVSLPSSQVPFLVEMGQGDGAGSSLSGYLSLHEDIALCYLRQGTWEVGAVDADCRIAAYLRVARAPESSPGPGSPFSSLGQPVRASFSVGVAKRAAFAGFFATASFSSGELAYFVVVEEAFALSDEEASSISVQKTMSCDPFDKYLPSLSLDGHLELFGVRCRDVALPPNLAGQGCASGWSQGTIRACTNVRRATDLGLEEFSALFEQTLTEITFTLQGITGQ
jgi:hypothetical protein